MLPSSSRLCCGPHPAFRSPSPGVPVLAAGHTHPARGLPQESNAYLVQRWRCLQLSAGGTAGSESCEIAHAHVQRRLSDRTRQRTDPATQRPNVFKFKPSH
ncbi:hypothetical protein OF83DRAFT_434390 [Amylostereum chailletii]|nr:hypothetical protein OF83DRAFT_434390 [Amylostereum chailletii]